MKERIGFIGIGQGGGNVVQELEHKGFNCFTINSSLEDLSTLDSNNTFHIPTGIGCNRNRARAKDLITIHHKTVIREVIKRFGSEDLIYLVFSTGGGTGSGTGPILLDLLAKAMPRKRFGAVVILPSDTETPNIHKNAYACFKELAAVENLATVFTLDNNKYDKMKINSRFAQLFNNVLDIPKNLNKLGNTDESEIWDMLCTRGNAVIGCTTKNQLNTLAVVKSVTNDIFADIETDKQVVYTCLCGPASIDEDDIKRLVGKPLHLHRAYNEEQATIFSVGLTFPKTRLNDIANIVNLNAQEIKDTIMKAKNDKIEDDLNWDDLEVKTTKGDNLPEINLDDLEEILRKY